MGVHLTVPESLTIVTYTPVVCMVSSRYFVMLTTSGPLWNTLPDYLRCALYRHF